MIAGICVNVVLPITSESTKDYGRGGKFERCHTCIGLPFFEAISQ